MKLKFISMAVFSALTTGVATSASAAPATVNGGTVHFKGEVVNAACAVNMNSVDQTVLLGQVRTKKLANLDDVSGPVGFNIQLDECDSTTSGSVKILFLAHLLLEKITPWLYKARHLELQQMLGFRYLTPQGIL